MFEGNNSRNGWISASFSEYYSNIDHLFWPSILKYIVLNCNRLAHLNFRIDFNPFI